MPAPTPTAAVRHRRPLPSPAMWEAEEGPTVRGVQRVVVGRVHAPVVVAAWTTGTMVGVGAAAVLPRRDGSQFKAS